MHLLLDGSGTRFLGLDWSWWDVVGFCGNALFFSRFIIQWIVSEKRGESVIPIAFWWFSITGSLVLAIYFVGIRNPVGILGYLPNSIIYIRNLQLIQKKRAKEDGPGNGLKPTAD
ncbi:MAG: lipid-A-disaccharide synthase N-terminal domain-containing protein [Planctomycetes bacterium]|nr:lipid-A-disaccharide synthase N-terminal domain-containing protein [Planctomycetota bacterium]